MLSYSPEMGRLMALTEPAGDSMMQPGPVFISVLLLFAPQSCEPYVTAAQSAPIRPHSRQQRRQDMMARCCNSLQNHLHRLKFG